MILNFIAKKILDYQIKKLAEAENELKMHLAKKKQLEDIQISESVKNDIIKEEEMIKIWTKNADKIKREIKKIQEK